MSRPRSSANKSPLVVGSSLVEGSSFDSSCFSSSMEEHSSSSREVSFKDGGKEVVEGRVSDVVEHIM